MRKSKTLSSYKIDLWKVFSKFIRERDKRLCITCKRIVPIDKPQGYHAGHCEPKSICPLEVYFSEKNVNGQCYNCNINLGGWGAKYKEELDKKWGKGSYEKIKKDRIKYKGIQWSKEDYIKKIEEYKKLCQKKKEQSQMPY